MEKNLVNPVAVIVALAAIAFCILASAGQCDADYENGINQPDSDSNAITSIYGIVYDIPSKEDRKPLEGVTVTTWVSFDMVFESSVTGKDGSFTLSYNSSVKYITFEKSGYKIQAYCSELRKNGTTGYYSIEFKDQSQVAGAHALMDESGFTVIETRTSSPIFGYVRAMVDGSLESLSNVTVSVSLNGIIRTTHTDSDGYFSIDCEPGKLYDLTFSCKGFDDYKLKDVSPSETTIDVVMTESSHTSLFGMDTAHMMALMCILLIILIILISISIIQKYKKGTGRIAVVNDLRAGEKKD